MRAADTSVKLNVGTNSGASTQTQPDAGGKPQGDKPETTRVNLPPIAPTTSDLFRMKNTYREAVRAEIMETQLDDRHDIKGNTIYRLAFDATVLPGAKTNALAIIKVTLSHNPTKLVYDYKELYYDWMRRMQVTVANSVEGIAGQLTGRFPDLRIRLTLTEFVLRRLCEGFLTPGELEGEIAAERRRQPRQCDPYRRASPELLNMASARKMLSEFSVTYRKFRDAVVMRNAEAAVKSNANGKDLKPEELRFAVASLQHCSGLPSRSVDITVAGIKTNVRALPLIRPLRGSTAQSSYTRGYEGLLLAK